MRKEVINLQNHNFPGAFQRAEITKQLSNLNSKERHVLSKRDGTDELFDPWQCRENLWPPHKWVGKKRS